MPKHYILFVIIIIVGIFFIILEKKGILLKNLKNILLFRKKYCINIFDIGIELLFLIISYIFKPFYCNNILNNQVNF